MLIDEPSAAPIDAVIVPLGDAAAERAQGVLADLRRAGVATDMAFKGNMKKRLAKADALGARYALILGDDEIAKGVASVKNLGAGTQIEVALDALAQALRCRPAHDPHLPRTDRPARNTPTFPPPGGGPGDRAQGWEKRR